MADGQQPVEFDEIARAFSLKQRTQLKIRHVHSTGFILYSQSKEAAPQPAADFREEEHIERSGWFLSRQQSADDVARLPAGELPQFLPEALLGEQFDLSQPHLALFGNGENQFPLPAGAQPPVG